MPIEDIVRYSGLTMDYFRPGVTLRIPRNKIEAEVEANTKTVSDNRHANAKGYFVGVDVSSYQDIIDWDKLASSVDFVIAKSNEGTEFIDNMFNIYAEGCEKNNIALGAYCFNGYWGDIPYDEFLSKQREQVSVTIAALRGKKVEAPVYFDIEGQLDEYKLPADYVKAMLDIWYTEITRAGYKPGIYSGQCDMNYLYDCVGSEVFDKFDIWVAGGYDYDSELNTHEIKPSYHELNFLYSDICEKVNVVQVTQYGYDAGASSDAGYVDLNFAKRPFKATKKTVVQNLVPGDFTTKRFYTSSNVTDKTAGAAVLGGAVVGAGMVADNKRKKTKVLTNIKENSGR
jgi:GH25 family lysozyme M1 (1,4-beta-N-acetylmuramidase)